jgi:hypothetical protein
MGGEDTSDAFLVSYHSTRRRLKKYSQKHFCYLIGTCCLNSYLLYKKAIYTKNPYVKDFPRTETVHDNHHLDGGSKISVTSVCFSVAK